MAKLTKRVVDQASANSKAASLWDDELKGFGLRVWPSGRKVYIVKCRIKGRQRFITLDRTAPSQRSRHASALSKYCPRRKVAATPLRSSIRRARRQP